MARTVERSYSRRTTRVEGADKIKANLTNIAAEVARVRDQAREEVSALEKIRGMLDAGYLNDLIKSIEELETRIEELEDTSLQAQEGVERYRADLEQEQDRLAKLWDAYKSQEDELGRIKRDYPLMEEKLFERERTIESMRREMDRMKDFDRYRKDAERLAAENAHLADDLSHAERRVEEAESRLAELEEEAAGLRELAGSSSRLRELENLLEEERERLAKLYKVYEDIEDEKRELEGQVEEWRNWYRRFSPAFASVGEAPSTAPAKS
jgi:chromosome segregation ATPase